MKRLATLTVPSDNMTAFPMFTRCCEFANSNLKVFHDAANSKDILHVNPWWVFNSTITCDITHFLTARLIVDNVFDKEPPFPALAAGTGGNFASATTLYFPGIIGRTYQLAVDVRF